MANFRQQFMGQINAAVANAIERNDQQYGRQLATIFERQALILRAALGGEPLWAIRHSKTELWCADCYVRPMNEQPKNWGTGPYPANTRACPGCGGTNLVNDLDDV